MPVQVKNSASQYGLGGRLLHWTSVALLLTLILTAAEFEDIEASTEKAELVRQHASYGLIFLLIMLSRLTWRCVNQNPIDSYAIKNWQKFAAYFLHRLIYLLLITQSLSGLLNLGFAGSTLSFFSLFEFSMPLERNQNLYQFFASVHFTLSMLIYPLFAMHIFAAIYHQLFAVSDD